jgi:acid phosphatase type 7
MFRFIQLILFASALSLSAQVVTKGPYLAEPKPGSIKIRWEVDKESKGRVYFSKDLKLKQSQKAVLLGEVADHFLYEAALEKLEPGTEYNYRVKVGRKNGDVFRFTAPPNANAACNFAISGDSRSRPQIFTKIIDGIAHSDPDFVISMGDLVEDGGNYEQWDRFYFGPAKELISSRPFVSTLGDHEGSGDEGVLFNHFLYPQLEYEKLWYSFDYGMVHFVSLDYRHANSQEMMEWFEKDIEASDARWKIVFMHRPPYNLGGHRSFWGNPHWPDLFQKHRVDVIFGGHSHIYERFQPVYTEEIRDWAITYITTGGSGASLYEAVQHPVLTYSKSANHYADVQLDQDVFKLKTYQIDGELLDSMIISKNPDGSQANEYLDKARLRNEMDILGLFAGPISWALEYPPLPERAAYKRFTLNSGEISESVHYELRLSKESLEHYRMEPFKGVLEQGIDQDVELKIWSKGGVSIDPWGHIDPPFRIEAHYKQGSIKGIMEGKYLGMISWGE